MAGTSRIIRPLCTTASSTGPQSYVTHSEAGSVAPDVILVILPSRSALAEGELRHGTTEQAFVVQLPFKPYWKPLNSPACFTAATSLTTLFLAYAFEMSFVPWNLDGHC